MVAAGHARGRCATRRVARGPSVAGSARWVGRRGRAPGRRRTRRSGNVGLCNGLIGAHASQALGDVSKALCACEAIARSSARLRCRCGAARGCIRRRRRRALGDPPGRFAGGRRRRRSAERRGRWSLGFEGSRCRRGACGRQDRWSDTADRLHYRVPGRDRRGCGRRCRGRGVLGRCRAGLGYDDHQRDRERQDTPSIRADRGGGQAVAASGPRAQDVVPHELPPRSLVAAARWLSAREARTAPGW